MTVPTAAEPLRDLLASPDFRRRSLSYGAAIALHALALVALLTVPPAVIREAERIGQALEVRFYTVAGGPDAETDAPLFEPPLAGGQQGTGPVGVDGGEGADGSLGAAASEDQGSEPAETETVTEPEPEVAEPPAPVEAALPEVEPVTTPDAEPSAESPDASIVQTTPQAGQPAQSRPRPTTAPPPSEPTDPSQPISTAQPGPPVLQAARPEGPPTFEDILARAQTQLDPEDFRIIANFDRGVTGAVRENFCLSSSDANHEAFDCPEGSQLAAARLAQFGLMGLGEEPPEFLEDMDRLAFELSQTGAGDTAIGRILATVREARRQELETPVLTREMRNDAREQGDNLGVSNPFGG